MTNAAVLDKLFLYNLLTIELKVFTRLHSQVEQQSNVVDDDCKKWCYITPLRLMRGRLDRQCIGAVFDPLGTIFSSSPTANNYRGVTLNPSLSES